MSIEKLVRDRIPDIIEADGRPCSTRIINGQELFDFLDRKLDEEVLEFRESHDVMELADIMEVLIGLADQLGCSEQELFELRSKKRDKRGGFEKGIVLINE